MYIASVHLLMFLQYLDARTMMNVWAETQTAAMKMLIVWTLLALINVAVKQDMWAMGCYAEVELLNNPSAALLI